MLAPLRPPFCFARPDGLDHVPGRWVEAQVDEVQGPCGEFERFLGREVFPEPFLVERLELLDPLRRRLREENIRGRMRHGHGDGLTAKAVGCRLPVRKCCRGGHCVCSPARAPCRPPCHDQVLIPNANYMSSTVSTVAELEPLIPEMPPEMRAGFEEWRQDYHAHMGKLARRGMERKAASGVLPCCAPVGYRNCRKKIEVDPVLAPLVRESFERAATSRLPLRTLLAEMTARGLVSRSGKPLRVSAFWYMLRNPFYIGMMNWKGELVQGTHEPLISRELFDATQARLSDNHKASADERDLFPDRHP